MKRKSLLRNGLGWLVLAGVLLAPSSATAQQESSEAAPYQAASAADPAIPTNELKVLLRPLDQGELEVELTAWLDTLKAKIEEVGEAELQLSSIETEAPLDAAAPPSEVNQGLEAIKTQLRDSKTEETSIVERVRTVIEALKVKGGDVEASEQFVNAISDLSETTDAVSHRAAMIAALTNWIQSDEGGKYWLRRLTFAAIILLVFWGISKVAGRVTARALSHHPRASNLLENFARRTAGGVVFVIGIMMALGTLGVPLGPLMAALGGGGFIVGFALQETLGNFASGMLIMVYRPFDLSDYVNVAGAEGTVKQMSLVSTTLATVDNKLLVIPNQSVWGQTITNFTGSDVRRVDLVFGIGYDDDIQKAIDVLKQVASSHELVLESPAPAVHVDALGDSSVNLFCRPWVKTADYWAVHWDLTREVKERFDVEGISFPYPQRDVHLSQATAPV